MLAMTSAEKLLGIPQPAVDDRPALPPGFPHSIRPRHIFLLGFPTIDTDPAS
jgi:hypothetical protein